MKCHCIVRSCVGLALLMTNTSLASAQHGGHGGGHGGHGGGHHGQHSGHFSGGHSSGHRGHSRYLGGHGIGHSSSHYGGHLSGGHISFGHNSGHHSASHYTHHWNPHFDFYVTPSYGGYGYSSYYSPSTYSGSYTTGYRTVENSPILLEQIPTSAIQQTATHPITTSEGEAYRQKSEEAFRAGDFQRAARMANHALVDMPRDGKLLLFAAQTLFAVGDYRSAAAVIHQAAAQLDPQQWGYVVENYRQFYRGRAFVDQMDRLNEYITENPDADYAHFLRGYQQGFLGHQQSALRDLNRTIELESRDQLAVQLITRFGGTPPANLDRPTLELSPTADSAPSSTALEGRPEPSSEPSETKDHAEQHDNSSHIHDH